MVVSLYFHIPFCTRKCDYCHFYVLPDKEPFKVALMEGLKIEFENQKSLIKSRSIRSIYFGGGTPLLLGPSRIEEILSWISHIEPDAEITLEANPEAITYELIQAYKKAGINRLSIGVQTFFNPLLKTLGRLHSADKAEQAILDAHLAGIENISIDLMYDLPGQTMEIWEETLHKVQDLPVSHLSLYNLTFEPHTVFFKNQALLKPKLPSEEVSLEMYLRAQIALEKIDLLQYEISAFAKDNKISIHNSGYWTNREFLGLGPSAFSFFAGKRFQNIANLNIYVKQLKAGQSPIAYEEALDPQALLRERFTLQLRLLSGVHLQAFESLDNDSKECLLKLEKEGLIKIDKATVTLTQKGILFYDWIASELI